MHPYFSVKKPPFDLAATIESLSYINKELNHEC